ncbi:MAG TPA: ADOP family duplicated permease [Dokdonella sp.]|uniref:ADOP family duplicated permease n=1 Tax=Dokdonella sp. TaxID=2291710 RepID=UPI002B8752EE|nr:ADOP family duplicated permease [Dokdonella sp.]HUD40573.1 ADOP family duplicated permease [Dokdonella sp.]
MRLSDSLRIVPGRLRQAARSLAARPLFAFVAIATLALGIGANLAVFSLVERLLLAPLPVAAPDRLVNLVVPGQTDIRISSTLAGDETAVFSYPMFRDLERAQDGAATLVAHRPQPVNLAYAGHTERVQALLVSGRYFDVLGLKPALGRLLGAGDDAVDGQAQAAVLGHAYWRDRLGADPAVIGGSLIANGQVLQIVGVAPPGFDGTTIGLAPQVYLPISLGGPDGSVSIPDHASRELHWVYAFARLAPGVTAAEAETRLDGAYRNAIEAFEPVSALTGQPVTRHLALAPGARGQSQQPDRSRGALLLAQGAALLVLLIACVNLANLQLARGSGRVGEMGVRSALGASRRQLLGEALAEPLLIALAGAAAALPIGLAGRHLLGRLLLSERASTLAGSGVDLASAAIALAIALVALLGFALIPARRLADAAPARALAGHAGGVGRRGTGRLRAVLVTAQIAFSMALLALAGLFAQSLSNIARADLGMNLDALVTFTVEPELNGYDLARNAALYERIDQALAALPGVAGVARAQNRLLARGYSGGGVSIEGREGGGFSTYNQVGPGYFQTLGIAQLAGRGFAPSDSADAPPVAVVNRRFVDAFGLDPASTVGRTLSLNGQRREIVGLVADAAYANVKDAPPPQIYLPDAQSEASGTMSFYVRSAIDPAQQQAAIAAAVAAIDPNLPLRSLSTLREQARVNIAADRTVGLLATALALLATLLAAGGLYGVLSYLVAERRREIGLRLALGATPARLRGLVAGQVGRMALVGGALGLVAALAGGRLAAASLYGLSAHDPTVLAGAAFVLAIVVALAAWLPARRAAHTDPVVVLRHD